VKESKNTGQKNQNILHHYICPSCGADQEFEPKDGCLSCAYCGRQEQIPESDEAVKEHSYKDYLQPQKQKTALLAQNAIEATCTRCSASIMVIPPDIVGDCSFCGTKIIAQPKSSNPLIAPEAILPFNITKSQATDNVKKWISSRWFAPNALKQIATQRSIESVYIPFWTYTAYTNSHYKGEQGEYYYVEKGRGQNKRQERKTKWYKAKGQVSRWFEDVLVPAITSLPRKYLDNLAPWDLKQLKPYDPAFLPGHKAQRYQIELVDGFETSKEIMASTIEEDVKEDIGGDTQRISKISTHYSAITFKSVLLPVYVVAYLFNQKSYQVLVNARTGDVQGDRPYSILKIVLFSLLSIILLIGLIIVCVAIPIIPIIIIFLLIVGLIGWVIYEQIKKSK